MRMSGSEVNISKVNKSMWLMIDMTTKTDEILVNKEMANGGFLWRLTPSHQTLLKVKVGKIFYK